MLIINLVKIFMIPCTLESELWICLQMILYDTPGVIEKKMHKLDTMMMRNVRNAAVSADCVVVVVDACKAPEKVRTFVWKELLYFG